MPFGLDSRSAMVPDGAVSGFGNLGAALLMAPQLRRKLDQQAAAEQADRDFRDRQLADAIQGRAAHLQLERDRLNAEKEWHAGQLRSQDQKISNDWWADVGSGVNNAAKRLTEALKATGGTSAGHENSPFKVDPYNHIETVDDSGKIVRSNVLKTPEEVDKELAIHDRFLRKAVNGQAPPPAVPTVVADRQARNQTYRQATGLPEPKSSVPAAPQSRPPAAPTAPQMGTPSQAPARPQSSPEVRQARARALIQNLGNDAPGDDAAVYSMTSDDPAEVEQALRTYYRGQPEAMKRAAAMLAQMHAQ